MLEVIDLSIQYCRLLCGLGALLHIVHLSQMCAWEKIVCGAEQTFRDNSTEISRRGGFYWSSIHGIVIHLHNI